MDETKEVCPACNGKAWVPRSPGVAVYYNCECGGVCKSDPGISDEERCHNRAINESN